MRVLMTGLHGTVAPVVASYLAFRGHVVVPVDRDLVDIEDDKAISGLIEESNPDWIFHLGMGSVEFTQTLVRHAKARGIRFLYTSTVMVFDGNGQGPYDIHVVPEPQSDYGKYKYESELAIRNINPDASIIRLGWQIGQNTSGNQMIAHLKNEYMSKGFNEASKDVCLACSFITESAKAMLDITTMKPGLYHMDQSLGMSFYDVILHLKTIHPWITPKEVSGSSHNNQMVDHVLTTRPLRSKQEN
jgi:dTDP-4-dehydrorhamnose reductase